MNKYYFYACIVRLCVVLASFEIRYSISILIDCTSIVQTALLFFQCHLAILIFINNKKYGHSFIKCIIILQHITGITKKEKYKYGLNVIDVAIDIFFKWNFIEPFSCPLAGLTWFIVF